MTLYWCPGCELSLKGASAQTTCPVCGPVRQQVGEPGDNFAPMVVESSWPTTSAGLRGWIVELQPLAGLDAVAWFATPDS